MQTGVFQHIYKCPVEYQGVVWTCNESIRIITESRKLKECFWRDKFEYSLSSEKIKDKVYV